MALPAVCSPIFLPFLVLLPHLFPISSSTPFPFSSLTSWSTSLLKICQQRLRIRNLRKTEWEGGRKEVGSLGGKLGEKENRLGWHFCIAIGTTFLTRAESDRRCQRGMTVKSIGRQIGRQMNCLFIRLPFSCAYLHSSSRNQSYLFSSGKCHFYILLFFSFLFFSFLFFPFHISLFVLFLL